MKTTHAEVDRQQSALAAMAERERLARKLHDGLAQVLGYIKMQAQACL
jgi:nitrate/nitrite-specific signal transduction histidine kinase